MPATPAPPARTLRLIGIDAGHADIPARPTGTPHQLGDQRIFSDDLFDENNQRVGQHSGFCTLVRLGPANQRIYQCLATLALPDGQITGRGLVDFSSGAGATFAVTGGTGAYLRTGGEISVTFPTDTRTDFTLHLA
jgi:hypothetical protein